MMTRRSRSLIASHGGFLMMIDWMDSPTFTWIFWIRTDGRQISLWTGMRNVETSLYLPTPCPTPAPSFFGGRLTNVWAVRTKVFAWVATGSFGRQWLLGGGWPI